MFLNSAESFLIQRFAKYSEIEFYGMILFSCGYQVSSSFNYLFALNLSSLLLRDGFKAWSWRNCSRSLGFYKAHEVHDSYLQRELDSARYEVARSNNFKYVGSFIYKKTFNPDKDYFGELRSFLLSNNRHLRKRSFEFLSRTYPSVKLNLGEILKCYDPNYSAEIDSTISLTQVHKLLPSIFAEIYLLTELRGDRSAILGANVYDIDYSKSYDILGITKSLFSDSKPIVLQSSLNALGPIDGKFGESKKGYLNLNYGSQRLVDSAISCIVKNYSVNNNIFPLYGIGLDHVDAKNDFPKGRASAFLSDSLESYNITHLVVDGSYLFSSKSESYSDLYEAYDKVSSFEANLLSNNPSSFLIDIEYCIGEMNYIDNSDFAQVPKPFEMNIFADALSKNLEQQNISQFSVRPSLFVANVGTTHHSEDFGYVDASITRDWLTALKTLTLSLRYSTALLAPVRKF